MPEYQYDAFISYRHLPLDMAIASQTQKLLENYKPPKDIGKDRAIGKLFRDQTELPPPVVTWEIPYKGHFSPPGS